MNSLSFVSFQMKIQEFDLSPISNVSNNGKVNEEDHWLLQTLEFHYFWYFIEDSQGFKDISN